MADNVERKRVTLHPLKSDGTIDLDVNLYPKTFLDGIVDREGNPVAVVVAEDLEDLMSHVEELVDTKQDKLTAGENITIDENNVISATGGDILDKNNQWSGNNTFAGNRNAVYNLVTNSIMPDNDSQTPVFAIGGFSTALHYRDGFINNLYGSDVSTSSDMNTKGKPVSQIVLSSELTSVLSAYAPMSALSNYASQADLSNYASQADLSNFVTESWISAQDFAHESEIPELSGYAKESWVTSNFASRQYVDNAVGDCQKVYYATTDDTIYFNSASVNNGIVSGLSYASSLLDICRNANYLSKIILPHNWIDRPIILDNFFSSGSSKYCDINLMSPYRENGWYGKVEGIFDYENNTIDVTYGIYNLSYYGE